MRRKLLLTVALICSAALADAEVQPPSDATRGQLLYATHCRACHDIKIHWRDKKLVTDWANLQSEVRRWAGLSGLTWSDDDVVEVTRYLNTLHYHYPIPGCVGEKC